MAQITLGGDPVNTSGELPSIGTKVPDFTLVTGGLSDLNLNDLPSGNVILNIFPSVDTGVCATSVRRFNQLAANLENTTVVCISKDLPFALARFCGAEGIEGVVTASAFRSTFGEDYGLVQVDGPLRGLLSRAIIVIDPKGNVVYTEQVPEIKQEPDYDAALAALA